jgi:hypothetical protein
MTTPRARPSRRISPHRIVDRVVLVIGLALAVGLLGNAWQQQRALQHARSEAARLQQALGRAEVRIADLSQRAGDADPRSSRPLPPLQHPIAGVDRFVAAATRCADAEATTLSYRRNFLASLHHWGYTELGDLAATSVTYLFSGPDVATAAALFTRSPHIVMVADQWVEPLEASEVNVEPTAAECRTQAFYARHGYYRTHDLEGKGQARPRFVQLLTHGLLLAQLRIEGAEYLAVDAEGRAVPVPAPSATLAGDGRSVRPQGLRFAVRRRDGSPMWVDYVRVDLSDSSLARSTAHQAYLRRLLSDTVLLKSASHLLQQPSFSITAGLVGAGARAVVQDESGLAAGALRQGFELTMYGDFDGPHRLWRGKPATRDLKALRAEAEDVQPLAVTFGYEKRAGSFIVVGRRPGAAAAGGLPAARP